jgi:hypothetical protein
MIQMHYIRYGILSGLLLLCTIALSATEDGQRLVFAQITPAPEKAGGSSSDTSGSNNNDDSSGSSSGSDGSEDSSSSEEHEEDSSDSSDVEDSNDSTTEDSGITTPEEETNPLLEAIMSKVTNELNVVGITDLGF